MEIRNSQNKLLCKADEATGKIEIIGRRKLTYTFPLQNGNSFLITSDGIKKVTRTPDGFDIVDIPNSDET